MKKKRKKKIIIFIIALAGIFSLFYYFINDNVKNNFLLSSINDLSANISNITSISFIKRDNYINDVKKELNNDYEKEIKKLKETLDLNTLNSDKKLINATVIKRSSDYWYNLVTIDKGSKDKIKKGYAVINANGLVGKVINVNKHSSDVKLLISLNSDDFISSSFNYENNEYYGLIDKYDVIKNELIIKNVLGEFDKEKIKNINVTTSGLSDSFSSGLLIGKIKEITKDDFGLSNTIIVKPTVNFESLDIVSVVVGDK